MRNEGLGIGKAVITYYRASVKPRLFLALSAGSPAPCRGATGVGVAPRTFGEKADATNYGESFVIEHISLMFLL